MLDLVFTLVKQEEIMEGHPSGVKRTRDRVIGVNFSDDLNSSYRGKFQWRFDQGKGVLVRVSGEFELSEFEITE